MTDVQRELVAHARGLAAGFSLDYWHEKDEKAEKLKVRREEFFWGNGERKGFLIDAKANLS